MNILFLSNIAINMHWRTRLKLNRPFTTLLCITVQCSEEECSAVQWRRMQCSAVHWSAVQCSAVQKVMYKVRPTNRPTDFIICHVTLCTQHLTVRTLENSTAHKDAAIYKYVLYFSIQIYCDSLCKLVLYLTIQIGTVLYFTNIYWYVVYFTIQSKTLHCYSKLYFTLG